MLLFPSVSFSGLIFNSNTLDSLIKADTGLQPVIAQEGLIANAGPDQTVSPEDKVTLDGTDSKGVNLTYYNWEQTDDGPEIVDFDESDDTKPKRTFTAPSVNQTTEADV